jgi:hypothetical protein
MLEKFTSWSLPPLTLNPSSPLGGEGRTLWRGGMSQVAGVVAAIDGSLGQRALPEKTKQIKKRITIKITSNAQRRLKL